MKPVSTNECWEIVGVGRGHHVVRVEMEREISLFAIAHGGLSVFVFVETGDVVEGVTS